MRPIRLTQTARAAALIAALPLLVPAAALAGHGDATVPVVNRDKVELVFVLDTTGSMAGLIDGAKRKIWFVANEILKSNRKPELRVGLVAYRDKGDAYVTKTHPLTTDLDAVYNTLMGFHADGGGDTPEHVNAGLDQAVNKMQWSSGKDVLKLVFLVGDAPPHMDYNDDVKHTQISQMAVRKNIYINTLQCGADASTTAVWRTIARNSEGRFAAIPQDGGVVAVATPFDAELRKLAVELDGTELSYGSAGKKRARVSTRSTSSGYAAAAPAAAAADRALAKSKMDPRADDDFVARVAKDEEAFDKVKSAELPDELVGKSREEQRRIVTKAAKDRKRVQKRIAEIEKKRASYIAKERKKMKSPKDSFDMEVVEAIKAEAAERGMAL